MKKIFLLIVLLLSMTLLICSCEDKKETEIVFDMGNGEEKSFKVKEFEELTVPEDPKREGYKFEGWYFDNGYQSPFTITGLFDKEKGTTIKIYSKWTAYSELKFKYEFYLDGGKLGEETVTGMNAPTRENPKKTDFVFEGWYLDDSFTKAFGSDKITPEMAEATTKLYAKMKPLSECEFNLQFTVDGAVYSKVLTTGTAFTYPAAPEKDGYAFVGWYLDEAFEVEFDARSLADCSISAPVIIYAKFIEAAQGTGYKVTFYVDGAVYSTAYTEDGKITLPKAPEKAHMTFRGWYYDIALQYKFNETEYINENKSLYARFENKEIIATLKNGNDVSSDKISYGSDYTLKSFSTDKTNKKIFLGWKIEGTDTLITDNSGKSLSPSTFDGDVTLVAVWDPYAYLLTVKSDDGKETEYFLKGDTLDVTIPDPESDKWYYAFDGWYTDENEKIDVNSHVFDKDITVTERFECTGFKLAWNRAIDFQFVISSGTEFSLDLTYDAVEGYAYTVMSKLALLTSSGAPKILTESASNANNKTYEIIIGTNAQYRGDECCIDVRDLGKNGYIIKTVGNKIVIAGGSDAATKAAFMKFVSEYVSFAEDNGLYNLHVISQKDINFIHRPEYPIENITIGRYDIDNFNICAYNGGDNVKIAEKLRDIIFEVSGYYLDVTETDFNGRCSCEHHILISDSKNTYDNDVDKNGDGFIVLVKGGNLIINSIYKYEFENAVFEFVKEYITDKTGSIVFDNSFVYLKHVSTVTYEQFGAKGDGVTDDFEALYNAHMHANSTGQKVLGKAGAIYYIGDRFTKTIPVKTSVDFQGATIIINDKGNVAFKNFDLELFTVSGEPHKIMAKDLEGTLKMYEGETVIPWLYHLFSKKTAMVSVENTRNIMYSQYVGANTANVGGIIQSETFIVDCYGNILNGDCVSYNFEEISYVEICLDYDNGEQIIENGNFKTIRAVKTAVTSGYYGTEKYSRGIRITYKSNVTLKNITHEVLEEPIYNQNKDLAFDYNSFIGIAYSYGVKVIDTKLYAQRQYLGVDNRNPSRFAITPYDMAIQSSADIEIDGLTLFNDRGITDTGCNAILKVVNTRNLVLKNSRINAVEFIGLLGGTVEKTTIGRVIELVGGGDLVFDEVVRIANKSFLELPYEYGAYFNGNITFKNCEMKGEKAYNSNAGESASTGTFANLFLITSMFKAGDVDYVNHEKFAGDFTMPYTVTVEGGLKVGSGAKAHVFQNISDEAFDPSYSYSGNIAYITTDIITFKGMSPIAKTNGTSEYLNSIPVLVK